MSILTATPAPLSKGHIQKIKIPPGLRIHVNEVVRALINRSPKAIIFSDNQETAETEFEPLLYLCKIRGVEVKFEQNVCQGRVAAIMEYI